MCLSLFDNILDDDDVGGEVGEREKYIKSRSTSQQLLYHFSLLPMLILSMLITRYCVDDDGDVKKFDTLIIRHQV